MASALLANGVRLVGRSFKLHRPRGIFSCGVEEPNGIVDLSDGATRTPNMRATQVELYEGLVAASVNCWPSVEFDLGAINNRLTALLPAGFYYKTFVAGLAFLVTARMAGQPRIGAGLIATEIAAGRCVGRRRRNRGLERRGCRGGGGRRHHAARRLTRAGRSVDRPLRSGA